jgi:hypothetical protein
MRVLCIEGYNDNNWTFYKGNYYEVVGKWGSKDYPSEIYTVQDEDGALRNFSESVFERYFLNLKRERKLKLEKINGGT